MLTIIQALPAILAARAIIAMLAILLAMLAMRTILLVASNDCQYCQLSAMCATTAINCPRWQLVYCCSCPLMWHYCCSCYELPSHSFLPADSKTANQQTQESRSAQGQHRFALEIVQQQMPKSLLQA